MQVGTRVMFDPDMLKKTGANWTSYVWNRVGTVVKFECHETTHRVHVAWDGDQEIVTINETIELIALEICGGCGGQL